CRITELVLKSMEAIQADYHYDAEAHHKLAIRAAQEAAVLLKNEDAVLPCSSEQQAAVIGALAKEPRYQGAGSSKINPIKVDNAWDALNSFGMNAIYSQGYTIKETGSIKSGNRLEEELIKEACEAAKDKDIVYIFAGLPEGYESEGFDRKDMSLPANQNHLIEAVVSVNPNVAVILSGGAPMELPWADKVKGILLMYLGGEGSGMAAANLILGEAVPSGKLAETWPDKLSDTPAYRYFPGGSAAVEYREGIYVGYRYYDKAGKHVRYPFGHGLSYASFLYSNLFIDKNWAEYRDEVTVSFDITNTSKVTAKETAMIWVSHKNDKVFLPVKELKEFVKIELQPGECKHVTTLLDTGSFGFYNTKISDWSCESGEYKILVGRSAHDICLQSFVYIHSPELSQPDYRESAPTYYHLPKEEFVVTDNEFKAIYGSELPPMNIMGRPYNASNTVMDVSHTLMGKLLLKIINDMVNKSTKGNPEMAAMMSAMLKEMPFHSMVASGGGALSENMLEAILHILNHHYLKGFYRLIRRK
ncbi:MAG TPA: glycoside hydrolase family 3 C-terminal domain-containing protein, partial [Mobilitalea sp.]|nr:glycoside hydrolase family 3 C-terminal domain-containing protein [Mobilitalea sp.]